MAGSLRISAVAAAVAAFIVVSLPSPGIMGYSDTDSDPEHKVADSNQKWNCAYPCHEVDSDSSGCLECHGGWNSPGTLQFASDRTSVPTLGYVNFTVEVRNVIQQVGHGIAAQICTGRAGLVGDQPQDWGWEIVKDTNGGHYNTNLKMAEADTNGTKASFSWMLRAPMNPGIYRFYARAHYGDPNSPAGNHPMNKSDVVGIEINVGNYQVGEPGYVPVIAGIIAVAAVGYIAFRMRRE